MKKFIKERLKALKYFSQRKKMRPRFRELKNKHKGQPGFVIGNGPSLQMSDLEKMSSFVTIGSNKIYLSFEEIEWRPSYYVIISKLQLEKIGKSLRQYFNEVFTAEQCVDLVDAESVVSWPSRGNAFSRKGGPLSGFFFSSDAEKGFFSGRTVTYSALQFAAHLGLNPIYLVGCDHNYGDQPQDPTGESLIPAEDCKDHFHPDYRTEGEIINPAMLDSMDAAFLEARRWAESNGIEILNATRGGQLEVFKRCDLDEILKQNSTTIA